MPLQHPDELLDPPGAATARRRGPDWARQAASSMRFLLIEALEAVAPMEQVSKSNLPARYVQDGKILRLGQIHWLCEPVKNRTYGKVVRADLDSAMTIIEAMNEAVRRPTLRVHPSRTTPAGCEDRQRLPVDCASPPRLQAPLKNALRSRVPEGDCRRRCGEAAHRCSSTCSRRATAPRHAHSTAWSTCRRLYWSVRGGQHQTDIHEMRSRVSVIRCAVPEAAIRSCARGFGNVDRNGRRSNAGRV